MVRPASYGVPRDPYYSGTPLNACSFRRLRGCHPLWPAFPGRSTRTIQLKTPATPARRLVWPIPISLAATYGIDVSFCSCRYLDVSVPCVRLPCGIPQKWWVSPFGNLRVNAYLQANRSLSHAITSFIASDCQGIHRVRLVT